MAGYIGIINKKIVRKVRRKLYNIICEHVRQFDDEKAMEHIEIFMEGVSWATGLRYVVRHDGLVYIYINCAAYLVIDVYIETKILRNSVNRHYDKQGCPKVALV